MATFAESRVRLTLRMMTTTLTTTRVRTLG
nr:MAG TPA: hypothetical protein [Caudoviricetes sp.]